jgi:hypothetical protein
MQFAQDHHGAQKPEEFEIGAACCTIRAAGQAGPAEVQEGQLCQPNKAGFAAGAGVSEGRNGKQPAAEVRFGEATFPGKERGQF